MEVLGGIGESLMEMDQTRVEIRWGNCEKMADVLTRGEASEWRPHEEKMSFLCVFCCFTYS